MRKKILLLVVGVLAVGALVSSCSKCKTCTSGSYSYEVCKGSGPGSNALYKSSITSYEASGYTCV